MFKLLPKSQYLTGMLYFLTEQVYMRTIYIKGSMKKNLIFLEKLFEKDLVTLHFVSDSIFKSLKFDYSSSDQKIKIKNCFYDCVFLEIRLTHRNQL